MGIHTKKNNMGKGWKRMAGWWLKKTILKNDGVKVNGKDDIPYMKWKIKAMFQTTNQMEKGFFQNGRFDRWLADPLLTLVQFLVG